MKKDANFARNLHFANPLSTMYSDMATAHVDALREWVCGNASLGRERCAHQIGLS